MCHAQLRNYRLFVTDAAQKLHLPPSFLVQGIEDGTLKTWRQALNVHEKSLHRAYRIMDAAHSDEDA